MVSNYERLSELSEQAAESQDASSLQVLKTMDSISAKTQQLQTSIQSLYVEGGFEELYKGVLDFGNGIATALNNLDKIGGKPLAAVTAIGAAFYNLANIVSTAFNLIRAHMDAHGTSLAGKLSASFKDAANTMQTSIDAAAQTMSASMDGVAASMQSSITTAATGIENTMLSVVEVIRAAFESLKQSADGVGPEMMQRFMTPKLMPGKQQQPGVIQGEGYVYPDNAPPVVGSMPPMLALPASTQQQQSLRQRLASHWANSKSKISGSMAKNPAAWSMGLSAASLAVSGIAAQQKDRRAQGLLNLGSGALSGAAMGVRFGVHGALIGGAIGFATSFVSNLSNIFQDGQEKLKELQAESTEKNNKALQKAAETKSLSKQIENLRKLERAQYDSAEAQEKYYTAAKQLTDTYPELIGTVEDSGNVTVDLATAEATLAKVRADGVKAAQEAALAAYKTQQQAEKNAQNDYEDKVYGDTSVTWRNFKQSFAENLVEQLWGDIEDQQGIEKKNLVNLILSGNADSVLNYVKPDKRGKFEEQLVAAGTLRSVSDASQITYKIQNKNLKDIADLVNDARSAEETAAALDKFKQQKSKISSESLTQADQQYYDYLDYMIRDIAPEEAAAKREKTIMEAVVRSGTARVISAVNDGVDKPVLEHMQGINKILLQEGMSEWNKVEDKSEESYETFLDQLPQQVADWTKEWNQWWVNLGTSGQQRFNELSKMFNRLSRTEADERLQKMGVENREAILNTYYSDTEFDTDNLYASINAHYAKGKISATITEGYAEFLDNLGSSELSAILDYYDQINSYVEGGALSLDTGTDLFSSILDLGALIRSTFSNPADSKKLDQAERILYDNQNWSLQGIFELQKQFADVGLSSPDIDEAFKKLRDSAPKSVIAQIDSLTNTLTKSFEDYGTAVSNAMKGMDLKKASELAAKLKKKVTDFRYDPAQGLYYFDDLSAIYEAYFGQNGYIKAVGKNVEAYAGELELWGEAPEYIQSTKFNEPDWNWDTALESFTYLKQDDITRAVEEYEKYVQKNGAIDWSTWVRNNYIPQLTALNDRIEGDAKSAGARAALSAGNITKFLQELGIETPTPDQIKAIAAGSIKGVPIGKEWSGVVAENFANTTKNTYEALIEGLEDPSKTIPVTEATTRILKNFINEEELEGITNIAVSSLTGLNIEKLWSEIDSSDLAPKIKKSLFTTLHNNQFEDNIAKALSSAIDNYQSIAADTYYDLVTRGGFENSDFTLNADGTYALQDLNKMKQSVLNRSLGLTDRETNAILAKIDRTQREASLNKVTQDIIKNRDNLSEENIQAWADALQVGYDTVKQFLTSNTDGSYSIDLTGIKAALTIMRQDMTEPISKAILQMLNEQIDQVIEGLTNLPSQQTNGYTKIADMQAFVKKVQQAGITSIGEQSLKDVRMQDLFQWDEAVNAFTMTNLGILSQAAIVREALTNYDKNSDEYWAAEKLMQDSARQLAEKINISGLYKGNAAERHQAWTEFSTAIDNYNSFIDGLGETADGLSKLNKWKLRTAMRHGGIEAVNAGELLAKISGKVLTESDIEDLYRNQATRYLDAIEEVQQSAGSIISVETAQILQGIEGYDISFLGDSGQAIIVSTGNVVRALEAVYERLKATNEATLEEINNLYAQIETKRSDADMIAALNDAAGMTYDTLGQIFTQAGYRLEEGLQYLLENGIASDIGGGKVRINNFKAFADLMQWDSDSEEYTRAFKAYNDSLMEYDHAMADNITEEITNVVNAQLRGRGADRGGRWNRINVASLSQELYDDQIDSLNKTLENYGAILQDGFLYLDQNANLPAIARELSNVAQQHGLIFSEDLAAIFDAIKELMHGIAESINKGLEGTLTNVEAQALKLNVKNILGIDLDFQNTEDGLRIATEQATHLYFELKQVDAAAAGIVFDGLKSSLTEASSECSNMAATLAAVKRAEDVLSKSPDNQALKERVSLYNEIALAQMNEPDSYSFMDQALPDYLKGPENYWNAIGKMFNSINAAAKNKGRMGIADFYNMVNELNNMAKISGQKINFLGQELYGDMDSASNLIQKGLSTLSNVDGKGAMINLGKIGINFAAGAEGMGADVEKGIHAMAQSQIDMLDGLIALLETIVQMEELGGIDSNGDMTIELPEIFIVDSQGNPVVQDGHYLASKNMQDAAEAIMNRAKEDKVLKSWLENIKLNGQNLSTLFTDAANGYFDASISAQDYQKTIQSLINIIKSDNYDPNDLASIAKVWAEAGATGEVVIDKKKNKKVAIGYETTLVTSDKKGHAGEYEYAPGKFTKDPKEALSLFRAEQENILEATYDKEHGITTGTREIGMDENTSVKINWILTEAGAQYSFKDENGNETTGATVDEVLRKLYAQYEEQFKANGGKEGEQLTPIDYFKGLGINIKYWVSGVTADKDALEKIANRTHEQAVADAQKLLTGSKDKIMEIATDYGIQITPNAEGKITEADMQKLGELLGVDSKIVNLELNAKFNGENSSTIENILSGKTVDLTVNIKKGTDEIGIDKFDNPDNGKGGGKSSGNNGRTSEPDISEWSDTILEANVNDTFFPIFQHALKPRTRQAASYHEQAAQIAEQNRANKYEKARADREQAQAQAVLSADFAKYVADRGGLGSAYQGRGWTGANAPSHQPTQVNAEISADVTDNIADIISEYENEPLTLDINGDTTNLDNAIQQTIETAEIIWDDVAPILFDDELGLEPIEVPVGANTEEATSAIQNVRADAEAGATMEVNVAYNNPGLSLPPRTQIVNVQYRGLRTSFGGLPVAKGNVALADGTAMASGSRHTLMGELGPELVVSNGRYFVVGQNGAEMVDLDPDAIVFNHLQTQRLLSTGQAGRGRPVTNERNAVSFATGNASGPAMASAAAALAALKNIRAMWQSMLNASLADMGQKGGGGGGGGGGKKNAIDPGFIADLERWYNLLRQIDKLEKDINYEENLRNKIESDRVINGYAYYDSQKRSLKQLDEEIARRRELSSLQKDYYDKRREDLLNSNYGKIFTFDENGLMQYNDQATLPNGDKGGLFALSKINAQNSDGSAVYTAREQYDLLKAWGFESELKYDDEGKEIKFKDDDGKDREEAYTEAVQAFWDKANGWKDELDGLYDSYREQQNSLLENETTRNELLQQVIDNQISVENSILQAIEERAQKEIDALQDERDALEDSTSKYIDGLSTALSNEQKKYENQDDRKEMEKMRRQLAILQRSGGSATQIANLQQQIDSKEREQYFNAQQEQIDAIQQASDLQLERLDAQIDLMTETLEYQKEHGLLWEEVYQIMAGTEEEMLDFITANGKDWESKSTLDQHETLRELTSTVEQWIGRRDDLANGDEVATWIEELNGLYDMYGDEAYRMHNWDRYVESAHEMFAPVWTDENVAKAKEVYDKEYNTNASPVKAGEEADKIFRLALEQYFKDHPDEANKLLQIKTDQVAAASSGGGGGSSGPVKIKKKDSNWSHDATHHWHTTWYTNGTVGRTDYKTHTFPSGGRKCSVCGYSRPVYYVPTSVSSSGMIAKGSNEKIKPYAEGGLVDYTGPAILHGTKTKPEAFLNAEETKIWRDDILSGRKGSLTNQLIEFQNMVNSMSATPLAAQQSNSNFTIEHAEVNMNATIANDYDARRAGEQALAEMVRIARKTGNQGLRR